MLKAKAIIPALLVAGILALANAGFAHAQPSFDCSKARTTDEKAICADPVLADLDLLVSDAYRNFSPEFQSKRAIGRALLDDRAACGGEPACIAAVLAASLSLFSSGPADPWPQDYASALIGRKAAVLSTHSMPLSAQMPQRVGQCISARIRSITTRFGDPIDYTNEDAGTAIAYESDGYQIEYGRQYAYYDLKAGQKVVVCLMSIPRDCPPGDERGRIYYALSVESRSHWILPDSQHMCGGA